MGYYINHRESMFTVKKENIPAMLEAVRGMRDISWQRADRSTCGTIEEAMAACRWPVILEDENITNVWFAGEKLGDEDLLFKTIAPFVEHGSYIEVSGGEDALWQWRFVNGTVEEACPTITWPDFPEKTT